MRDRPSTSPPLPSRTSTDDLEKLYVIRDRQKGRRRLHQLFNVCTWARGAKKEENWQNAFAPFERKQAKIIIPQDNHTMILQVVVGVLSFYLATGFTLGQYFVNPDTSSLTSQPYLYNYQPESLFQQYPNDINKPIIHSELGFTPQYHNLVYNYVKDFAGTEPPQFVSAVQPFNFNGFNGQSEFVPQQTTSSIFEGNFPTVTTSGVKGGSNLNGQVVQTTSAGIKEHKTGFGDFFLPSDTLSLANQPVPENALRRNFELFKTLKPRPTSPPPIGGIVSDYVLLRNHQTFSDFLPKTSAFQFGGDEYQQIKRESPDDSESVVIEAEPFQNTKNQEEPAEHKENDEEETEESGEDDEAQPGIAQSKPAAIALAGPGGVAQASPVATALVGHGGLAVSAPSGTAVAGTNTQGGVPIQIGTEKEKKEKPEDTDSD